MAQLVDKYCGLAQRPSGEQTQTNSEASGGIFFIDRKYTPMVSLYLASTSRDLCICVDTG
jgi:hypothetical protein